MNRSKTKIVFVFICLLGIQVYGQNLKKPDPEFTYACASATFNTFKINFKWDPPAVNGGNRFILEMSDKNGSFASATSLATETNKNTNFDFDFQFSFPTDVAGTGYKFRVRSTDPAKTSPETDAFQVYYKNVNQGLVINNLEGSINICGGSTANIAINNFPDEAAYIWYKNGTIVAGQSGNSISVTEPGTYYAEVDYGTNCSSATTSNGVTVSVGTALGVAINGNATVEICSGDSATLEVSIQNPSYLYTWKKDGVAVTAAAQNNYTFEASEAGDYSVEVSGAGVCTETSGAVQVRLKDELTVSFKESSKNVTLMPGGSKTIGVDVTGINPTIQWYRNNVAISGATNADLTVTQTGTYKVEVKNNGSCSETEIIDNIKVENPSSFTIAIAATNDYQECISATTTLSVSNISAVTSGGTIDVTNEFKSQMSYQWHRNGSPISGATSASLSIANFNENDSYYAVATIDSFTATATAIEIKLAFVSGVQISAPVTAVCSGGSTIKISSDSTDAAYTYAWFKDNVAINGNESSIQINQTGTYELRITAHGCTVTSNSIQITPADESAIKLSENSPVILVEGTSKTISASGGSSYIWYDADNNVVSNTAEITVTEAGTYKLVASLGDCEVVKTLVVSYKENFNVPNVITPNADGINDLWVLPNTYSNKEEVEVIIYNSRGQEIFKVNNYQNNWPESSMTFSIRNIIYYYRIQKGNETLKRGTLTIIQ